MRASRATCRAGSPTWAARFARSAASSSPDAGADTSAVVERVTHRLDELRATLPATVQVVKVYDRTDLVSRVDKTLLRALAEEIAVVMLVIFLFLLDGRSALVPLCTLPVVIAFTFLGMWLCGVPASLMSLGGMGIALGIAVDADVVALEACHRRLESAGKATADSERRRQILAAAASFAPAILTSLLITGLSFLPVFAFTRRVGAPAAPAGPHQDAGDRGGGAREPHGRAGAASLAAARGR